MDPAARREPERTLLGWAGARSEIELHLLAPDPLSAPDHDARTPRHRSADFPGRIARGLFPLLHRLERALVGGAPDGIDSSKGPDSSGAPAPLLRISAGDDAVRRISALGLDLIVHFGPHPMGVRLAGAARLGVVGVEHDGEFAGSSATSGFWQVLRREPTTGFIVTAFRAGEGARITLRHGNVRNRFSYVHNQVALHRKSLHALQRVLLETAGAGRLPEPSGDDAMDVARPERGPTTLEQLAYFGRFLRSAAGRILAERGIGEVSRWTVHYATEDWTGLDMAHARPIPNPRRGFLADPFVIEEQGRTFCFAEELVFGENRGCIAAYELKTTGAERFGRVIEEPFHMSFPYLFRYRGVLYMLPETSANRDIRVYRCVGMPGRWELAKVLMTDVSAADTMVFEHGGRWWMLTNLDPAETGDFCSELHVFHASEPLSDQWTPHPMNPVITDALRARNGGLLSADGALYRVSQSQAFDTYGSGFGIHRIDVLTPQSYVETSPEPEAFGPTNRPERVHHLHSNGRITVFDRCRLEDART